MTKIDILNNALNGIDKHSAYGLISTINDKLSVLSFAHKYLQGITDNKQYKVIYSYGNPNTLIIKKQLKELVVAKYITSFSEVDYDENEEYIMNKETEEQYPWEDSLLKWVFWEPLYIIYFNSNCSKLKYLKNIEKLLDRKTREERIEILGTTDIKHCIEQYNVNPDLMEHFLKRHSSVFPSSIDEEYLYDLLYYIKIQFKEDYNYFVEWIDDYKEKAERIINITVWDIHVEADKQVSKIVFRRDGKQLWYLDVNKTILWKILMYCFQNNEHWPISLEKLFLGIWLTKDYLDADKSYRDAKYQFLNNSGTTLTKEELNALIYKEKDKHIYLNYNII